MPVDPAFKSFHPVISRWFQDALGVPTPIQKVAWPKIAEGKHVLVTAPTGTGKTFTAFLWAINQLVSGVWDIGQTSVLYVSPLKALNNDIQRNLIVPLEQLRRQFDKSNIAFPEIRVQTRSGDTPSSERRKMLRRPPEIFITTPESLNILLSTQSGQNIFSNLRTVVLDEIHAVVGSKRGTHLITAVDRLVPFSGEFQRIALSATVRPLKIVSEFVGGYRLSADPKHPQYDPRSVSVIEVPGEKPYMMRVFFPEPQPYPTEDPWLSLIKDLKTIIANNRSTLIFVNNRRLCERITLKINAGEDQPVAYAHHGSLSKPIREHVEYKLKNGELKAIVATNSLELGIDIGALDEVVLIQCPPKISSGIQRIGRSGHRVGEISRGTLFPTYPHDILESAVLTSEVLAGRIEDVHPIDCPLDVLAQIIVSMAATQVWDIDDLFTQIRSSYAFHGLSRSQFDLVLQMLNGRYEDTRIRELKSRILIDRESNTVIIKKGATLDLFLSGGVIPDRGYFHLRHDQTRGMIGELDEEFVWEARIGQSFTLGTQHWKIQRITHNDVFVTPASSAPASAPFWRGEGFNRDFFFSEKIGSFLEQADTGLHDSGFRLKLKEDFGLDDTAADHLIGYLDRQKEATQTELPHRHHLLVEHVRSGPGGVPGSQIIIHTFWGGCVNRPFSMALDAAWQEHTGQKCEVFASNDSVSLVIPEAVQGSDILSWITSQNLERLIQDRLESSGFFGARFRENAGRALLITRKKMNERLPLWMSRLKSQKLFQAVRKYKDFPILLETWRSCLKDEFDIESLHQLISELETSQIRVSETQTDTPSPMAGTVRWRQVNEYMYMGDRSFEERPSELRQNLLEEVVFTPGLRPEVSRDLVQHFEEKRQRLSEGYAPSESLELLDWVDERICIPVTEWKRLLDSVQRDVPEASQEIIELCIKRCVRFHPPSASQPLIATREKFERLMEAWYTGGAPIPWEPLSTKSTAKFQNSSIPNPATEEHEEEAIRFFYQWLQYYGPVTLAFVETTLGLGLSVAIQWITELKDTRTLIAGRLTKQQDAEEVCDSENFEMLLRLSRRDAAPSLEPLNATSLPLFFVSIQSLTEQDSDIDSLRRTLEQLICYSAPAQAWEEEILPARLPGYQSVWFDSLLRESDLRWIGGPNQTITLCFDSERDFLKDEETRHNQGEDSKKSSECAVSAMPDDVMERLFPDPFARYDLSTLMRTSELNPSDLSEKLWEGVWEGRIGNDTFESVRKGLLTGFRLPDIEGTRPKRSLRHKTTGARSRFSRWKGSLPYAGNWFLFSESESERDLLEIEELKKSRVRILLDRYGIVFRELLQRELPVFQWRAVFRSLRLMELSGEVVSGYFFEGIPGLQFASHRAVELLKQGLSENSLFWVNASDPASCCGISISEIRRTHPHRLPSTHLVYRGTQILLISNRFGKELDFRITPDDPGMESVIDLFNHLLTRTFRPLRRISVETINDIAASKSPYTSVFQQAFNVNKEPKRLVITRRIV